MLTISFPSPILGVTDYLSTSHDRRDIVGKGSGSSG